MSERKVLNKYYPPDFDPSKIPRMKLAKNRQYTVRLMAPFNMRCITCGEYIYKGKKFNARKEDVEHETYLGIRIYRFYIKCTRCLQEISFKTDPRNTDYEIEAGATRNFMALKLAEEQARKEEEELREEEANNPMKLLENRTQQSRNEIELLESLEELKDLNRRQQSIDYDSMLQQFDTTETERQRLERQEREDEDYVKSIAFKIRQRDKGSGDSNTKRIVAEEIVEDVIDENDTNFIEPEFKKPHLSVSNHSTMKKIAVTAKATATSKTLSVGSLSNSKNSLKNIVKRKVHQKQLNSKDDYDDKNKQNCIATVSTPPSATTSVDININTSKSSYNESSVEKEKGKLTIGGLSLLAAYSDSSEDSN